LSVSSSLIAAVLLLATYYVQIVGADMVRCCYASAVAAAASSVQE